MLIDLIGYLASPLAFTVFTLITASTHMLAKKFASLKFVVNHSSQNEATYTPIIFEDIAVLAALTMGALPNLLTSTWSCSWMYLTASLQANRYPLIIEVGWILCFTSSCAFLLKNY
jgi:hypothetical protein